MAPAFTELPVLESSFATGRLSWSKVRELTWRQVEPGKVRITLDLPTDLAAEWPKANECSEDELREDDAEARNRVGEPAPENDLLPHRRSARQYRADAVSLTGSKALAHRGEAVSKADRYRVLIDLDARVLEPDTEAAPLAPGELSPERPTIPGFGPISIATARRIAASAGLTVVATAPGPFVLPVPSEPR